MTDHDISLRVRDILADTLDLDAALITDDANLLEDLGLQPRRAHPEFDIANADVVN